MSVWDKQLMDIELELRKLPELYATDGMQGDRPCVYIFLPEGDATWVIWEFDPEDRLGFGMCDPGLGSPEMGYVALSELFAIRGKMLELPVEKDDSLSSTVAAFKHRGYTLLLELQERA